MSPVYVLSKRENTSGGQRAYMLPLLRRAEARWHRPARNTPGSSGVPRTRMVKLLFPLLLGLVSLGACRPHLIPNTDVEDTDKNRAIVDFCEGYRKAVERRNIPYLLKLAHEDYYEDGGNIDSTDDLDRAGLESYLQGRFSNAKAIRYEIRYRRIGEGRKDVIYVDYTYSASYKLPGEEGDVWRRTVADNRLELLPQGESFLILSGM